MLTISDFVQLSEAYETLFDERKRVHYDANYRFPRKDFVYPQAETKSKQERDSAASEAMKTKQRDNEWTSQNSARWNNIMRLRDEARAAEVVIQEVNRKEREAEAQEKQAQGWLFFLSRPWGAKPVETPADKIKRQREQQQQRTKQSIKLARINNQLTQAENEHRTI